MKTFGYKAFDKDLKCQGYKYEVGKTHKFDGVVELCKRGFHFCKVPLDIFDYWDLIGSRFAEVEADGETRHDDNKSVTANLTVKKEVGIADLIEAQVEIVFSFCFKSKKTVLSKKVQKSSGTSSQLAASGTSSKLAASGHSSQLDCTGKDSVVAGIGYNNTAKAAEGCWIVLAEWENGKPISVKAGQIGKDGLKADTLYALRKGEFVEVK